MSVSRIIPIHVPHQSADYVVYVGAGLVAELGVHALKVLPEAKRCVLMSDSNVIALHGKAVTESLTDAGLVVDVLQVVPGEASKNAGELVRLVEGMIAIGLSRSDLVVALGGGVVGDLAGLAAALCMRGVAVVQCPTSLLAQVDASVGGKVAVDLTAGKNLLGTFHFPSFVLVDPNVLMTLPDREFACGLAEMLKHALLFDADEVDVLMRDAPALYARDHDVLMRAIERSIGFKAACVAQDPFERERGGGRKLLNLGHTVGHALEWASQRELLHGEAIALGLRATARISERLGVAASGLETDIVEALTRLRLPTALDPWLEQKRTQALLRGLVADKKRDASAVSYIALERPGTPRIIELDPREIVRLLQPTSSAC